MSDSDAAGQVQVPATTGPAPGVPSAPAPEPTALLVLDRVTGCVAAGNPAGWHRLAGLAGSRLGHRLDDLATATGHRDDVTARTWPEEGSLPGADGLGVRRRLRVQSLPVTFRSRECLLVVLRDDEQVPTPLPVGAGDDVPGPDHRCAAFTLDAVGRVDSWGPTPQRLIGHRPEYVIGADTTLLHPAPGRLAGDHHRALTHAYRTGEHRAEGWRVCSDGGVIWAEVITVPLYDAVDELLGFAQVLHDLTLVRRLRHGRGDQPGTASTGRRSLPVPGPRAVPAPPASAPRTSRRPTGRIPVQRRRGPGA
ncbi:MAG TPA: PAS domain S-box protein [Kineosporiaceae bacterium]